MYVDTCTLTKVVDYELYQKLNDFISEKMFKLFTTDA